MSDNGSVVVGSSYVTNNNHGDQAFIWDAGHGMRSLKDLLTGDYGLDLTGWTLRYASGVSDDGMTIVGSGTNPDGNPEGWIVTIPEPLTVSLLALGSLAVVRRRRG